jgi:hypothetical protein
MLATVAAGCGAGGTASPEGGLGTLRAAVQVSDVVHDVTAVRFDVVGAEEECGATPLASDTVSLEAEAQPDSLTAAGTHPFADGLFVLPAGEYRVCGTPLAGEGASSDCAAAEALAEVAAGVTTEVALVSQCDSAQNGGVDAVLALNDQPQITELDLQPSGFVTICEATTLTVTAADANDDALTYAWSVVAGPDTASLRADGATATFSGPAGDYTLSIAVDDGHGGTASLEFPVHVADAVCEVPSEVQAIFDARCSPCHTSGSSGGLHLSPASASFANLVNVGSSSAACAGRTRVLPGDPGGSYLLAKLHGDAGICGARMPRNLPPLPDEEIATIQGWIADLPH